MIEAKYVNSMGSDLSVVNAARVSYNKTSQELSPQDKRLIRYLARNRHTSPFGHCFASFHIKAPIFVARQLVKHKFLRWNEVSRRYTTENIKFYEPDVWRGQAKDKKQGSEGVINEVHIGTTQRIVHLLYQSLLERGVCEEQARMILPQNTMTEWYWSGSLDAFSDMCMLRCKTDTQLETRIVANMISEEMSKLFPLSWEAMQDV